jgi:GntR family transcriptional repressor for pyruvate dehydrogenase complex
MNMVATILFDTRIKTVKRATDLKESAEMHRHVYRAIREHDPEAARHAMSAHLSKAQMAWEAEAVETHGFSADDSEGNGAGLAP